MTAPAPLGPNVINNHIAKRAPSRHDNTDAAMIPLAGQERPFTSIEDLWRRAGIPVSALERLADADAFGSIHVNRRDALWTIRGLGNEVLPLFAAADRRADLIQPESIEPDVTLIPMTEGRKFEE